MITLAGGSLLTNSSSRVLDMFSPHRLMVNRAASTIHPPPELIRSTSTPFPAPVMQFHNSGDYFDSGHLTILDTDFNGPASSLALLRC
ncbi:uncharacterized protein EI90DRAFT_3133892 [Cantharellus anzutake]|uniref:uncharacterized protein n=1 Tax=Cantharellus anzutake TaxID=1750568 RepID=UPI001905CDB6|nr:uncharacterized protein EI90DRAFT_3133892 [Cantharellus anzutake]KAF8317519.1 hypothetical protein EI90DRAFT_3133892 [Cantharellus anzutake]